MVLDRKPFGPTGRAVTYPGASNLPIEMLIDDQGTPSAVLKKLATADENYRSGRGSSFMRERAQLAQDGEDVAVALDVVT